VCALVRDGSMATGLTKPEKVGGLDRILDGRTGKKEEVSDGVSSEHGLIPMSWSPSAHIYTPLITSGASSSFLVTLLKTPVNFKKKEFLPPFKKTLNRSYIRCFCL